MTTELASSQQALHAIFDLERWASPGYVIGAASTSTPSGLRKHPQDQLIPETRG